MKNSAICLLVFLVARISYGGDLNLVSIAAKLDNVESKLQTVTVESTTARQDWDATNGTWVQSEAGSKLKAWIGGLPGSKIRIDYDPSITIWTNGSAPFFEEKYSIAFNGEYGTLFRDKIGPVNNTKSYSAGQIFTGIPPELAGRHVQTGEEFSINFALIDNGITFLNALKCSTQFIPTISQDKIGETPLVRIDIKFLQKGIAESLWLDPNRSFSMVKRAHKYLNQEGQENGSKTEYNIINMKEILPGVWYPTEAEFICYTKWSPVYKIQYSTKNVIANAIKDDSVFTIQFPAGSTVHDDRFNTEFVVGESPSVILDKLMAPAEKK